MIAALVGCLFFLFIHVFFSETLQVQKCLLLFHFPEPFDEGSTPACFRAKAVCLIHTSSFMQAQVSFNFHYDSMM